MGLGKGLGSGCFMASVAAHCHPFLRSFLRKSRCEIRACRRELRDSEAAAAGRPKAVQKRKRSNATLGQAKGCRNLLTLALSLRMRIRAKLSNLRHDPPEQTHRAGAVIKGRARQSTHWQHISPRDCRDCGHRHGQHDRCGDHVACQIRHLVLRERSDQLRERRVLARKALQH